MDTWIQFGILLTAIVAGILHTDRRITRVEEDLKAEQRVTDYLDKRIDKLESKLG